MVEVDVEVVVIEFVVDFVDEVDDDLVEVEVVVIEPVVDFVEEDVLVDIDVKDVLLVGVTDA